MKGDENDVAPPKNKKSVLGKMSDLFFVPSYFKSEWSFAQFRIPDIKTICAFGPNNNLIGNFIYFF